MDAIKNLIKKLFPIFWYRMYVFVKTSKANRVKDKKIYCEKTYKKRFGVPINLDKPDTFYGKINYLRLFWHDDLSSQLVDKHLVKEYLIKNGYEHLIAKEIACYPSFKAFRKDLNRVINENKRFVVKLTHTSGDVFFFNERKWTNKKGYKTTKRVVFGCLRNKIKYNYYYENFERMYRDLKGSILIEEYLPSLSFKGLNEFKFFCNYGKPILINYVEGRQNKNGIRECFITPDLSNTNARQDQTIIEDEHIAKPSCFDEMVEFCNKTVASLPLVRVDLLLEDNTFKFCEFTFYDCGGYNIFLPDKANYEFGDLINIQDIIK